MIMHMISPLQMQWEKGYEKVFKDHDMTLYKNIPVGGVIPDIRVYMWCDKETVYHINNSPKVCRNIVFIRRYEIFSDWIMRLDWRKVDACIVVNEVLGEMFKGKTGVTPFIVHNGVDTSQWKWKERKHGKKIAVVGFINQKKNLPLAMQIMAKLPDDYELHLAGGIQDLSVMVYLNNLSISMKRRVYHHNQIPMEAMDWWLDDKDYLLSCSISEGSPNNVIEAMTKGIKPVVHNWPGAKNQFNNYVFNTIDEAVLMFNEVSPYNSQEYRDVIEKDFGLGNYLKVKEIILGHSYRAG